MLDRTIFLWGGILLSFVLTACGSLPQAAQVPPTTETVSTSSPSSATAEPTATVAQLTDVETPTAAPTETFVIDLDAVPMVDINTYDVPPSEIYFDTFRRVDRTVPLSQANETLIEDLRDAIPPIYEPNFVDSSEGEIWMSATDIVVGYADGGEAYAYPVKILNWHEMVSHEVNGRPILATY